MADGQEFDALIAEAEIGQSALKFMESELGQCLLGMAEQEIEAARIALETVDPNDTKSLIKLQNQAALGRMFKDWLAELFNRGENAMRIFEHDHQNE